MIYEKNELENQLGLQIIENAKLYGILREFEENLKLSLDDSENLKLQIKGLNMKVSGYEALCRSLEGELKKYAGREAVQSIKKKKLAEVNNG